MMMENVTGVLSSYMANTTNPETATFTLQQDTDSHQYTNLIARWNFFTVVSFSITCILGITGNGFVIWVGIFKMTRTVNVIWFLNLAIADFIFDIFLPLHIVPMVMEHYWPFGDILCKITNTILYLNMLTSISILVVISIDRCVSVLYPVWSRNHRTPSLACMIAFATWLFAVILSSPYPAFYEAVPFRDINVTYCFGTYGIQEEDVDFIGIMRYKVMIITRFVSMFVVPFIIIIICYGAIALKIKNRKHQSTSSRPYMIIITIIVLFFISWFPFHVLPLLDFYIDYPPYWFLNVGVVAEALATSLAYFNSCLNPILYVFMGRDFKDIFRKSFLSVFEGAFNEELTVENLDGRNPPKPSCEVESQLL
ncbi:chemerin-like receptor 1 [Ambystoma mexicanum]|uniref:chemerin-like receptor 1 n=1 Tax=Ambystoma mexicanum TaxID=8296 RepID=UPI0037E9A493